MVSSYSGLLIEKYGQHLDASGSKYLQYVAQGSSRMRQLVDGMMNLAQVREIDQGSLEPVSLREALDAALANLALAIEESGVEISVADLPSIRGSAIYLTHLFQNVVDNAIKFRRPARLASRFPPNAPGVTGSCGYTTTGSGSLKNSPSEPRRFSAAFTIARNIREAGSGWRSAARS